MQRNDQMSPLLTRTHCRADYVMSWHMSCKGLYVNGHEKTDNDEHSHSQQRKHEL